jgi:hypothetical protein
MWTKRVAGRALLLSFLSLIAFTYLAVYFWNDYEMELTGLFTALASAAPIVIIYVFYVARPVWAVQAFVDEAAVERAIRDATVSRRVEPVNERKGVFRTCSAVLQVANPACTIGWYHTASGSDASTHPVRSTVFLVPRSWDRKAIAAFRDVIAGALALPRGPA